MKLAEALRHGPAALLWGPDTWLPQSQGLALWGPEQVLVAHTPEQVAGLIRQVEREQARGSLVVGYLSYEVGGAFGLRVHAPSPVAPLAWMAVFAPAAARLLEAADLAALVRMPAGLADVRPTLNVTPDEYCRAIGAIKDLIAAGDTYQVNYTCQATFALEADPLGYFAALVRSHPVPYAAFLNLGETQILSLSPELFLQRRGEMLTSRPMKGTRRRGRGLEEDRVLQSELVTSEKDRAENLMIVDMVRNDLGRVCAVGSVAVPALFETERYRSVWQMTSTVTGRLGADTSLLEVLEATFPGASVTGAPKKRTMEIIHDLEQHPRGPYTGAIGLFLPGGDFTCNLPIRTLVHREGRFTLGIGAGIVWDSVAHSEYEETLLKSQFAFSAYPDLRLLETLRVTQQGECTYLEQHLQRLADSARYWGFPCDTEQVRQHLTAFCRESTRHPCVVRLELTQDGDLTLTPRDLPPTPDTVRVLISDTRTTSADRFLYHKTSQRALYDREREAAVAQGFFEVLFRNERGHLTEGAITNLFLQTPEGWLTPPVADGLLPGVWREAFARQMGAREQSLTVADLARAMQVVIGNSVREAIRVDEVWCDSKQVFSGPGKAQRLLRGKTTGS